MAKHCLFYAIEYYDNDIYPDFNTGWYVGVTGAFRDTPEGALARYKREADEAPEWLSVRLVESRVLEQKNRGVRGK
jgi:hypothetical protein